MNHSEWPELWALWIIDLPWYEEGGWVQAGAGVTDGPEVYFTRREAERAAKYNEETHGISSEPRRITVGGNQ